MSRKRLLFIDFLRFWAIYLMFWDHSLKLFFNFRGRDFLAKFSSQIFSRILSYTSLSSALFLYLAGFSLFLSFKHKSQSPIYWLSRKWKRGIILILFSYLLFFFTYGLERLDLVATSGILQLVGLITIFGSLIFLLPRKLRIILIILLNYLTLIIDLALRIKKINIPLLNANIFPILPHISYALTGILVAEAFFYFQEKNRLGKFLKNLLLFSLVGMAFLLSVVNFNPYLILEAKYTTNDFWQPQTGLVIFNTFLISGLFSIFALYEKKLAGSKLVKGVLLFGQEALPIYVLHIILGWGIARYLLKGMFFGFWAPLLGVAIFLLLGRTWIRYRKTEDNYPD